MRNFYRQGPPPTRPYQHYYGQGRMPNYGYPPPHRYHPGMIPPAGPKGTNKIESFMETCNRLLATAQGFQPYIAQATPLIRNLPSLWRLYRGFSSAPKGKEDDDDIESSEFNLDSSSFEYVYKDDEHNRKPKHSSKHDKTHTFDEKRHSEKTYRHKYEREQIEDVNHKRGGNRFFPVPHERRREQEPVVEKLARPLKTKQSVPRIFQPPHHFDD